METLRKLEVIKLIKELDFLESEYQYRSEIIREIDTKFKVEVENVLNANSNLKDIFTRSIDRFTVEQVLVEEPISFSETETVTEVKNPKIKNLYRTIAKTTHPDKMNDDSLKELYIQATKAYEDNDLVPLISICDKLKIPFEVDDDEFDSIKKKINDVRSRTNFLETTYPWQWHQKDGQDKIKVVLAFIQSQIF